MKGASDEDGIWKFFSRNYPYYYHKKNWLCLGPPSGFSRHSSLFWPFSLCQPWLKIFQQRIWVIIFTKNAKFSVLEVPLVRNNSLLLCTFCTFKNPIGPLNLQCSTSWYHQNPSPKWFLAIYAKIYMITYNFVSGDFPRQNQSIQILQSSNRPRLGSPNYQMHRPKYQKTP